MPRPRKIAETRQTLPLAPGLVAPYHIITEAGRNGYRISVTRTAVMLRLDAVYGEEERQKLIRWGEAWAQKTFADKPQAFEHFRTAAPPDSGMIRVMNEEYRVDVKTHRLDQHLALETGPGQVTLRLAEVGERDRARATEKILAKYFGNHYLATVARRVHELNDRHFRRTVRQVKLSDSYSRWGSCSSTGNINLATRLLMAPPAVLDAVIIHELAHLVEANHGNNFWRLVREALPNYLEYDEWLKEHGGELRFRLQPVE